MAIILGLDVSTTCTGICIVRSDVEPDSQGSQIQLLTHVDFKKCKTLWDKADVIHQTLKRLAVTGPKVDHVCVEEPLMGFRAGMSSAATIALLLKFNGIVSYLARGVFNVDPQHINAPHARKLCGIKVKRVKECGKSQKEQVFEHMCQNDLKHKVWPTKKRSTNIVDWARDETDAYVIARAGTLLNK